MARPAKGSVPRHEKILEAAADLFNTRGFAGVGVDEIGEKAGVTGPAIYRHFSGKDEILATLFDQAIDKLISATAGDFTDPGEALDYVVRAHAAFALRERRLAAVLIQEGRSLADPYQRRLIRRERQYVESIADKVAACYPTASRDHVLAATWTAIGTLNSVAVSPREVTSFDGIVETVSAFVLNGFRLLEVSEAQSRRAS